MKKLITLCLAAGLSACLFAELNLKTLVNPKYYDELISKGEVTVVHDDEKDAGTVLFPNDATKDIFVKNAIKKDPKGYSYFHECLFYKNKADLKKSGDVTLDEIGKVIRSVSKMQGMTYYSSTKKKECVLYDKAYMIKGPGNKTKVPDQNTGNADGQVSYCLQDDNSFGVNTYKLSYFQKNDSLLCRFDILDKMGLGPFNAIYPGKMVINILVIDCGDDLLLYLNTDLDSIKIPGIKGQITDSMSTRMDAVYKWFITQF